MTTFIVRRLLQTVVVLFIVTMFVFLFMQLLPGDPARVMLGADATQEQIDYLRQEMGLDHSIPVQYFHWLGNVFQGDLGKSLHSKDAVLDTIAKRLPITFQLGIYSLLIALIIGIPAGVIAAVKRGSAVDSTVLFLSNTGISVPSFWLAILGVYLFSMKLGVLPVQGYVAPWVNFGENIKHLIMPVVVLSMTSLASIARQTRAAMLEVIRQDYIRTARSKGLKEGNVIVIHALRNALIPIITLIGLSLGHIVGGTVFIETIFNIPGMGRLIVQSILAQDYIVVQGCVLVVAAIVALVNLIVDIAYSYADPRIHYN